MPNRILKESIFDSEKIASLSDFEYRLWTHLILLVDDVGRGDARPAIIKGRSFPLRERVTTKDIQNALCALAAKGCVSLYEIGGKPYFLFPNWRAHQRVRDVKPKYPEPEKIASADNSPQIAADCGLNPIQSNTNPIQYEYEGSTEQTPSVSSEPPETVITLTLNDKTEYPITVEQCQEWAGLYPAVDVIQQLRAMRGWLDANPQNRKTERGILRFVNGWLAKEQNRARPAQSAPAAQDGQRRMRALESKPVERTRCPDDIATSVRDRMTEQQQNRAAVAEDEEKRRAAALRALSGQES